MKTRYRRTSRAVMACLALVAAVAANLAAGGVAARAGDALVTLTVRGVTLSGRPDNGDSVNLDRLDGAGSYQGTFRHGVVRFKVAAGTYFAFADFSDHSGGRRTADRIVIVPQFTVSGERTLRLAERSADSRVRMVTPRPSIADSTWLELFRSGLHSNSGGLLLLDDMPVWISPVHRRPSLGTLSLFSAQALTSPTGTRDPYSYSVATTRSGLIPSGRQVIKAATLAAVHSRYYQDVCSSGTGYSVPDLAITASAMARLGARGRVVASDLGSKPVLLRPSAVPPGSNFPPWELSLMYPLRLPGTLTQYYTASPSLTWATGYWESYTFKPPPSVPAFSGGQNAADQIFRPGEQRQTDWNAYPLHPAPNASLLGGADPVATQVTAGRSGNRLQINLAPFGDSQPGHTGAGFADDSRAKISGSYVIDQNGIKIAAGNAALRGQDLPPFQKQVKLAGTPSVIRMSLTASRTGAAYRLSTRTSTVWTWRSVPPATGTKLPTGWTCSYIRVLRQCAAQPLLTLDYHVHGLTLNGTTAPGPQGLGVAVAPMEPSGDKSRITSVSVSESHGGHGWHAAPVSSTGGGQYLARFSVPAAGACVSLRVQATDAAGSKISETISCGYRTATRAGG